MRILSLVTNGHSVFYRQQRAGLRERGHEVETLAVPGYSKNGDRSWPTYARYYPRALAAAFDGYDLVHANYGLTAPPAVAQPTIPVVLTLWGSDLLGRYGMVSRCCARFADEVVVMSDEMAEQVDRPCHVIPHGIDMELFRPLSQSAARRELGWDEGVHQVLFPYDPSRPVKNFELAERVVELARERIDEPIELQTGGGIDHDRIPLYMNAADVMLLTSHREGSPNTVKEAMACDLPVVATAVGDLDEQLADVAHSTVASTDEGLAAALCEALEAGERSDGRSKIAEIGLQNQLDRIERVFESALETA